jgi:hypothetical protein
MKRQVWSLVMFALILVATISTMACTDDGDDDDDNDDDGATLTIDGTPYDLDKLFKDSATKTITGSDEVEYSGIALSDLLNNTDLINPQDFEYSLIASDGYTKNVTWVDLYYGVLVEEETMTAFTHLPGKYRVRDMVQLLKVNTPVIEVTGWNYTWMQPFDKLEAVTMESNESNTHEGVLLSDLVNDTGLENPEQYNYTITAEDGFAKTVSWENMTEGLLVKDEHKSVFPQMDKQYWIKDIKTIQVEDV